jgi:hypothetical protein
VDTSRFKAYSNYEDDHILEREVEGHIARKTDLTAYKILMKRKRKLGRPSRWEGVDLAHNMPNCSKTDNNNRSFVKHRRFLD